MGKAVEQVFKHVKPQQTNMSLHNAKKWQIKRVGCEMHDMLHKNVLFGERSWENLLISFFFFFKENSSDKTAEAVLRDRESQTQMVSNKTENRLKDFKKQNPHPKRFTGLLDD